MNLSLKLLLITVLSLQPVLQAQTQAQAQAQTEAKTSAQRTADNQSAQGNWSSQMQHMSSTVKRLIPFAYSRSAFHAPGNLEYIREQMTDLQVAIKKVPLNKKGSLDSKDPLVTSSLALLASDLTTAQARLADNHKEEARRLLQGAINHCFRCHSRSQIGPEYTQSDTTTNGDADLSTTPLTPSEQADLLVATRQYAKAMQSLDTVLRQPLTELNDYHTIKRALKKYLALAVRIRQDPTLGIKIIEQFQQQHRVPLYFRRDLAQWLTALKDWQANISTKPNLTQALQLIETGNRLQSTEGFEHGYVEYLRGSAILHELLRNPAASATEYATIYLALGNSYETITALGLWELPEIYYEACIHESPNSQTAKSCYMHFEHTVLLGYTGSSGTNIPEDALAKLQRLCQKSGIESGCYPAEAAEPLPKD
jgi:hypothetical protein